jgi:hypothetical protein
MKKCCRVFFLMLAVAALSVTAQLQTSVKSKTIRPSPPELKVTVISSKETYFLREDVFTKTEFLNLTDKTLCFPEPSQDCEITGTGSVITSGEALVAEERETFVCHADSRGRPREELLTEIEQHWIKLAPNAAYTTKLAKAQVSLSVIGPWRLKAIYHPPECSFSTAAECASYLQSAAQRVGCVVPEVVVTAAPVTVSVVPPPDQKQSIK